MARTTMPILPPGLVTREIGDGFIGVAFFEHGDRIDAIERSVGERQVERAAFGETDAVAQVLFLAIRN